MKKISRIKLSLTVVFFLFFILNMIYVLNTLFESEQTELNTVERSATVADVIVSQVNSDPYIKILTEEYSAELLIPDCMSEGMIDRIDDIKKNEIIFFRIESFFEDDFNKAPFANIVSLRIEDEILYSLDDYNTIKSIENDSSIVNNIIIISCFFMLFVFFGILTITKKRKVYN